MIEPDMGAELDNAFESGKEEGAASDNPQKLIRNYRTEDGAELGRRYGVGGSAIRQIISGRTWSEVTGIHSLLERRCDD